MLSKYDKRPLSLSSTFFGFSSHSQMVITRQPKLWSSVWACRSRFWVLEIFCSHHWVRVFWQNEVSAVWGVRAKSIRLQRLPFCIWAAQYPVCPADFLHAGGSEIRWQTKTFVPPTRVWCSSLLFGTCCRPVFLWNACRSLQKSLLYC